MEGSVLWCRVRHSSVNTQLQDHTVPQSILITSNPHPWKLLILKPKTKSTLFSARMRCRVVWSQFIEVPKECATMFKAIKSCTIKMGTARSSKTSVHFTRKHDVTPHKPVTSTTLHSLLLHNSQNLYLILRQLFSLCLLLHNSQNLYLILRQLFSLCLPYYICSIFCSL
jgi:hypothetical protein